jgi:uncharacterized membrane protein YeaQ/YmgE (transglycosylase-associated protein family)
MLLGVVGAFIGGSLHTFMQAGTLQLAAPSLNIPRVFVAVLGEIIAIFLCGLLFWSNL